MLNMLRGFLGSGKPARERRRVPPPGQRPNIGASLVKRNVVMKVTQPISDEFWDWLVLAGWREVRMSKNRRKYVMAPVSALPTLARASAQERDAIYEQMLGPMTTAGR